MKLHIKVEVLLQQDFGFEQNKKVFCLPRNIGETKGIGTNELIKKGAILVTSSNDILRELGLKINTRKDNHFNKNSEDSGDLLEEKIEEIQGVDGEYIDIYNLIPYYPVSIENLARKSELRISEINQKLTILELEGLIKSLPGNSYVRI